MKKVGHEEALPAADGEEVDGSFEASFRGWRLEEVLHIVVVLGRRRTATGGGRRRQWRR
jgi:hypothetical protein